MPEEILKKHPALPQKISEAIRQQTMQLAMHWRRMTRPGQMICKACLKLSENGGHMQALPGQPSSSIKSAVIRM